MSQSPFLVVPSMSVEKLKFGSADRSVPASLAEVSEEERWKSSIPDVVEMKETVWFVFEFAPGAVASEEML